MLTKEERRWIISNSQEYIKQNMAICDEEIKTRKLKKFLAGGEKSMSIADIRVLEAVTKLHEAARVVEQDICVGTLSQEIRKCADRLNDLVKAELHTEK